MNSFLLRPGSKISLVSQSSCDTSSNEKIESQIFSQNLDQSSSLVVVYLNDWKKIGEKNKIQCNSIIDENLDNEKGITLRTKRVGDINIPEAIKNLRNEPKWKKF